MSCVIDGLFPVSEAGVYLALGDQRLSPDVTLEGDALMATTTATASAEQEGARQLVCNVTLGGESRETRENVTVYSKSGNSGVEPEDVEGGGNGGWGRGIRMGVARESRRGGADVGPAG